MSFRRRDESRKLPTWPPADSVTSLEVLGADGRVRAGLLLLPDADLDERVPLIMSPHPWGLTAAMNLFGEPPGNRVVVPLPGLRNAARQQGLAVLTLEAEGRALAGASLGWQAHLGAYWTAAEMAVEQGAPIDLGRVAAVGLSMGGMEALLLAAHDPDRIRAVAVQNPITDLVAWQCDVDRLPAYAGLRALIETEVGGGTDEAREAYLRRSPISFAETLAAIPIQIRVNAMDDRVPAATQGHRLADALTAANGRPDLVDDLPHELPASDPGRAAHEYVNWEGLLNFVARHVKGICPEGG